MKAFLLLLLMGLGTGAWSQMVEVDSTGIDTIVVDCKSGKSIEFNRGWYTTVIFKDIIPTDVPNVNFEIISSVGNEVKEKNIVIQGFDVLVQLEFMPEEYYSFLFYKGKEKYSSRRVKIN